MDFETGLEKGKAGERIVVERLAEAGWAVMPTFEYAASGAPYWYADGVRIVAPDIVASKGGEACLVEVKTKRSADWYRSGKCYSHGFSNKLWRDYCRAADTTGLPVYIVVLEVESGQVLMRRIDALDTWECECRGCRFRPNPSHLVYFRRDNLQLWFELNGAESACLRDLWGIEPTPQQTLALEA